MKFGVVVFPGSNCDEDLVYTLRDILHQDVVKLWHKDTDLQGVDLVVLPGGFSYGDYLRSGAIARFSPIMGEVMRHALVEVLARGDIRDPDVTGISITVSEVRVSPDLKNATVFVLPLAGRSADKVMEGLNRSAPYLRGQVAKLVNLRHAPRLAFTLDRSFDHAEHIDRLLRKPQVATDLARSDED